MLKFSRYMIAAVAVCYAVLLGALQLPLVSRTQPIDKTQPISRLADPETALTFARVEMGNRTHMLLVIEQKPDGAMAIDLSKIAGKDLKDPFDALDHFGQQNLIQMFERRKGLARYFKQNQFLASATGARHISFGTNFLDHGEEVSNETPFRFPRLNEPTASISSLTIDPETQMLDYEVELCMRFDRPVASLDAFDAARKLIFLCGDFSDRKKMLEGMPDNEEKLSGIGFTDAKSLPGFFPTGPYMVVPRDWRTFVAGEAIGTSLNGASMQHTSGNQMLEDFRSMANIALHDGTEEKWTHRGQPVSLLPTGKIEEGQVLLSGTTGGVLFRPPSLMAKVILGAKFAMTGRFLTGVSGFRSVVNDTIKAAIDEKIMLMPGDTVVHHSARLGSIRTAIEAK